MINMGILLGLQVSIGLSGDKIDVKVSHNEHRVHFQVLTHDEFLEHMSTTENFFSDGDCEEPSNRLYVSGLYNYCIFENSLQKDIDAFTHYASTVQKHGHPALQVVIMIDVEDDLV